MRQVLPYVAQDGKTTYRVRYRQGERQRSETFRLKKDAEAFAKILDAAGVGAALDWLYRDHAGQEPPTFGEWFESWAVQLTGITVRTRQDYRAMHRRYLTSLDPIPLPLIGRPDVAQLVNGMQAQGYSAKTIKHTFNLLSTVMATAQDDGLIARNPVKRVRLPRVTRSDSELLFLTRAEAAHLYAATDAHYRPLVAFLLGTGLRWSEATALQVRHVDLENGTVRVDRAWKRIPGGFEIGTPKSEKSRRTVNAAVDALLAVQPLIAGRKQTDLVFTTKSGGVVRHSNFYARVWRPACERAGMEDPRPTIHDCRSTFGSWLISDGIPLESVQDQLGHESYETTRKIYAHLLPAVGVAAGRAASAAMAEMLALAARDELADGGVRSLEAGADSDEPARP